MTRKPFVIPPVDLTKAKHAKLFKDRMLKVHQAHIDYQMAIRAYVAGLDILTTDDENEKEEELLSKPLKNQFW